MRRRARKSPLKARGAGFPLLSAFILVFGICIWTAQVFATTTFSDCEFGLFWTSNWFHYRSLFQTSAFALGLLVILWTFGAASGSVRGRAAETAAQGVLLLALAIWLTSLKAYLFPFAQPTKAQVDALIGFLHPLPYLLEEERVGLPISRGDLPDVEFTENPMNDPKINKRLPEIFTSRYSPTAADMERLELCVVEQGRAAAQWEKDRKALEDFERDKERQVKPVRPRDWREELDP
jgi:hypothetical protein